MVTSYEVVLEKKNLSVTMHVYFYSTIGYKRHMEFNNSSKIQKQMADVLSFGILSSKIRL